MTNLAASDSWSVRWTGIAGIVLAALVVAPTTAAAEEEGGASEASEIIERALDKQSFEFETGRADLKLVVEGKSGDRSMKRMTLESKRIDGAARTMVELTHPEDLKGQAFLFAENEQGEDDVWMYVPAFESTRRIEGSKKQGAFLGSHFTYSDMETRDVEQATYEKTGEDEIGGHAVHVIEATPKSGTESEYGSIVVSVRKSDDVPLKFVFRDDSGEVVKRLLVQKVATSDEDRKYIKQMKMESERGGYSIVTVEAVETDVELPDSQFSKDQLGK